MSATFAAPAGACEPARLFIPLTKVDEEKRLVYGVLAEEALDKSGEIFDYESSKPYFEKWSGFFKSITSQTGQEPSAGNLRSQHTSKSVGKFTQVEFDDVNKRIPVCAYVHDDDEWTAVKKGLRTGFSIGGGYVKKWGDPSGARRYTADPSEGSLVDNPCMYGATFTAIKADGSDEQRKFAGETVKPAEETVSQEATKSDGPTVTLTVDAKQEGRIGKALDYLATRDAAAAYEIRKNYTCYRVQDIAGSLATLGYMLETLRDDDSPATESVQAAVDSLGSALLVMAQQAVDRNKQASAPSGELGKRAGASGEGETMTQQETEALAKSIGTSIATSLGTTIGDAIKSAFEAGNGAITKTVGEELKKVGDAVTGKLEEFGKRLDATDEAVKKIANQPAPVGAAVPVQKSIGGDGASPKTGTEEFESFVKQAELAGCSPATIADLRMKGVEKLLKNTH